MTETAHLSLVESLILVRMLTAGQKGEVGSKVKKDLEPLLAHQCMHLAVSERVDQAITSLQSSRLLSLVPGKTRKAAPKLFLTADGRRQALEFLGVTELRPKTTWTSLRKTYLPARALGLSASTEALFKTFSSDPAFQAVLLRREYDLPIAEIPKLDEATDALAWKLIGFDNVDRKFTLKNIKTALFNRALGDGRLVDFKKAIVWLLAQRLSARRADVKELRDVVLRSWLSREEADQKSTGATGASEPSLSTATARPIDLPWFAARVKSATATCPTGRFGDNKVFIAHVWRALQTDPVFQAMELATFKKHLAEANNARLLDLSRADLVQAMDPNDVRQSEVHYLNATFHFVRI
jgi:hypothetical protein